MSFSCDLVQNATKHKQFLEKLHELGVTMPAGSLAQQSQLHSLFRYHQLWLPLVNEHPHEFLIPPPDIAWLWHCHRLSPVNYLRYIRDTFGEEAVIDASPPFSLQIPGCEYVHTSVEMKTQNKWKIMYHDEPFFLPDQAELSEDDQMASARYSECLLSGFDLLASANRQATFLWQISGERFNDVDFLEEGVENYIKFLKLKPNARVANVVLVPTYQIDLIWHTHILSSIYCYNRDCKLMVGEHLNHDDSLTDRSEGGVLDLSYNSTVNLWKETYKCEYAVCGGMYRGEPPVSYFSKRWSAHDWHGVGAGHSLVRQMGASSTPSQRTWVHPNSRTSYGSPAFIKCKATQRSQLKGYAKENDYILGKESSGVGWYHIETKEAIRILLKRCDRQIAKLESEIAYNRACMCCNPFPQHLDSLETRLEQYRNLRNQLLTRFSKSIPPSKTGSNQQRSNVAEGDVWYITPAMYLVAGGACGGTVACGPGSCGGSACAGGACGGGGGGCGGGGCGGGGCGGGGCGG